MTTETELTPKERIEAAIKDLGLTLEYQFVPFSQSRSKNQKHKNLNWIVTLRRGNGSLSTEYSAGCGYCPAYLRKQKGLSSYETTLVAEKELETGFECTYLPSTGNVWFRTPRRPILPSDADVISSLVLDASVLDWSSFEGWAGDFGYETDSRSAEATYKACLEIALKLRAMVGDTGLRVLQEACQDY